MKNNEKSVEVPELEPGPRQTRRDFVRKAVYAAPVILSLPAAPSFAQTGSGGGAGSGDPGTGNPGDGPTPIGEVDCDNPLTPTDSDVVTNMCELTSDQNSGQTFFQDIIVDQDTVPDRIAQGDLLGTCDAFLCNLS